MQLGYRDRIAEFITPLAVYLSNDNFLMRSYKMLIQKTLKEILEYDPETGFLTWINNAGSRGRCGYVAGTINAAGYIDIRVNGKTYKAHRLAWLYVHGEWPNEIDHVNHVRDDNRILNIRNVTRAENGRNQSTMKTNKSGHQGISKRRDCNRWESRIAVNGKDIYLGLFKNKDAAIEARKLAEIKYNFHKNHGEVTE